MIRCDQLVGSMIPLSPLNKLFPVLRTSWQFVRPIHPVDARIHVVLVARSDLKNSCDPIVVRLLPRLERFAWILLPFDRRAVGHKYEAFAPILDAVD